LSNSDPDSPWAFLGNRLRQKPFGKIAQISIVEDRKFESVFVS